MSSASNKGGKDEMFHSLIKNIDISSYRSSRLELLCKKRCSWKFHKIHGKTSVQESLQL